VMHSMYVAHREADDDVVMDLFSILSLLITRMTTMSRLILLLFLSCCVSDALSSPTRRLETPNLRNQLHSPSYALRGGASSSVLQLSPEALRLAETLAPKVGILTSTALYFAPAAAVWEAIKSDNIGDLNPLPLAIMSIVSVSWLAYGLASQDVYVALSCIAGCVGSIGYVVAVLPLLQGSKNKKQLRATQAVVMLGTATVLGLWTTLGLSKFPMTRVSSTLGMFASALFCILSASPLSTIKTVVKTRNSSSILGTVTAAQVINCMLWGGYGLAVQDKFLWGPNFVGLGLGLMQLTLKILFPAKTVASRAQV
jgi:solute carrier family 50 protein (sugar transporter)